MDEFDEEKAQRGLEKLKDAFIECNRIECEKVEEKLRSAENIDPSDRYKRGINRILRERHGIKNILVCFNVKTFFKGLLNFSH